MVTPYCLFTVTLALAALLPAPAGAQFLATETIVSSAKVVEMDSRQPARGWDGLARLLDALKPKVNTELPLTPTQFTDHIQHLLNEGKAEQALQAIERRQAEVAGQSRGTDVQFMFQHARTLVALGRSDEAIAIYSEMTMRFPELPEPWNNLGALYAARGELNKAHEAVQMALQADADYTVARANLADLQHLLPVPVPQDEKATSTLFNPQAKATPAEAKPEKRSP